MSRETEILNVYRVEYVYRRNDLGKYGEELVSYEADVVDVHAKSMGDASFYVFDNLGAYRIDSILEIKKGNV